MEITKKTTKEMKKETIFVFSAHTDDFVLGAGGTIANYVEEGKKVIPIVFSLGEKSHFWLKDKIIKDVRSEETFKVAKFMKCNIRLLNLKDQHIYDDFKKNNVKNKLLKLIEKEQPTKIFTHSNEDLHPDHKAVNKITFELFDEMKVKPEVYIYSIWNPVSLKTAYPVLYVDIKKTFSVKMKALKLFKSQHIHISYPVLLLIFNNIIDGLRIKKLVAEKFFRIK